MRGRMTGCHAIAMLALASAGTAMAAPRYAPANLLHSGYVDKLIAPGVWEVGGGAAQIGAGHAIALYRAAELARAAGASEIRIVRQKITVTYERILSGPARPISESATLTVRAVRDDTDRSECEETDASRCLTLSVAQVLAQFGPEIGQSAGDRPELAAMMPRITTSGRGPVDLFGQPVPVAPPEPDYPLTAANVLKRMAFGSMARLSPPPSPAMPAPSAPAPSAAQPYAPTFLAPGIPPVTPPMVVAEAPSPAPARALDPYEAGRLAGLAARAASDPGN